MTVGVDDVDCSQIVSVPFQHLLDCHASNLQTELGILFKQVTRCAAERAWVSRSGLRKIQRQIEEPGILRGSKPTTAVAAQFSQIQQNLLRVAGGGFPGRSEEHT